MFKRIQQILDQTAIKMIINESATIAGVIESTQLASEGKTVGVLSDKTYGLGLDASTLRLIPEQFQIGEDVKDAAFNAVYNATGYVMTAEELDAVDKIRRESLISHLPRS